MLTNEIVNIVGELRDILGKVAGVKELQERFGISYLVVVEDEETKTSVQEAASVLATQAGQYGFDLEIGVYSQKEVDEAKAEYSETPQRKLTFKKGRGKK